MPGTPGCFVQPGGYCAGRIKGEAASRPHQQLAQKQRDLLPIVGRGRTARVGRMNGGLYPVTCGASEDERPAESMLRDASNQRLK